MPMESGFGSASWPLRDEHVRLLQVNWLDPLFGARLATLPARALGPAVLTRFLRVSGCLELKQISYPAFARRIPRFPPI